MRLTKRAERRLQQVRARARSARTNLAAVRTAPCPWPEIEPLPPLPSRPDLLCGKRCDVENPQSPARRGNAREPAGTATIRLRRLGRPDAHLHLHDISTNGFQVVLGEAMQIKDHVVTRLPGLEPIGATVAWTSEGRAGLRFDRPLHPAVFELLLTRLI